MALYWRGAVPDAARGVLARRRGLTALDLLAAVVGAAFGGALRLVGAGALRATLATAIAATGGTPVPAAIAAAIPAAITAALRVARPRVLGEDGRGGGQDTRENGTGDNS